eukprot:13886017-Ditylum_brightwellii.AAC.1
MTTGKTPLKWQNAVQNHQNGEPLPVLDPTIDGYEPCELYQWEMCVQFHSRRVSMLKHMSGIGKKIKNLLIKLQESHGKDKFSLFSEKGKHVLLKTSPQKPEEAHALVDYSVKAHEYKNISMIFHIMSPILFHALKPPIYQWLQLNKLFMTKTIFKSLKDNTVCISYLTHLNPIHIDRAQYQDDINALMEALADEKEQKDLKFYRKHNTTKEFAKFQIHLRAGKAYVKENNQRNETNAIGVYVCQQFATLSLEVLHETASMIVTKSKVKFVPLGLKFDYMIKNSIEHYKMLIREQNAYLTNYADFCVGRISAEMLEMITSDETVKEN